MKSMGLRYIALMGLTLFLLGGCSSGAPKKPLTCQDDPKGRSLEEQREIGDACFRSGSFRKSSGQEW